MTTPYNFISTYDSHACLYNSPVDCSSGSLNNIVSKNFDQMKTAYDTLTCASNPDTYACYYAIEDLSNALYQINSNMQFGNVFADGGGNVLIDNNLAIADQKRKNLESSVEDLKDITNKAVLYPTMELYDSTIATGTLWLILGTTMLYYVFKHV